MHWPPRVQTFTSIVLTDRHDSGRTRWTQILLLVRTSRILFERGCALSDNQRIPKRVLGAKERQNEPTILHRRSKSSSLTALHPQFFAVLCMCLELSLQ